MRFCGVSRSFTNPFVIVHNGGVFRGPANGGSPGMKFDPEEIKNFASNNLEIWPKF